MPNSFAFFIAPVLIISVAACYLVFNSYFNQPLQIEYRPSRDRRRRRDDEPSTSRGPCERNLSVRRRVLPIDGCTGVSSSPTGSSGIVKDITDYCVSTYVPSKCKTRCSICLEDYVSGDEVARLQCLCLYHVTCIDRWFEEKASCPVHTDI